MSWSLPAALMAPTVAPVADACASGDAANRPRPKGKALAASPMAAAPLPIAPAGNAMPRICSAVPTPPDDCAIACAD
jgi:hypothetical protein